MDLWEDQRADWLETHRTWAALPASDRRRAEQLRARAARRRGEVLEVTTPSLPRRILDHTVPLSPLFGLGAVAAWGVGVAVLGVLFAPALAIAAGLYAAGCLVADRRDVGPHTRTCALIGAGVVILGVLVGGRDAVWGIWIATGGIAAALAVRRGGWDGVTGTATRDLETAPAAPAPASAPVAAPVVTGSVETARPTVAPDRDTREAAESATLDHDEPAIAPDPAPDGLHREPAAEDTSSAIQEPELTESVDELLARLDAMIGLSPVKSFVRDLVVQVQADQRLAAAGIETGRPTHHMVFEGNPGTGKTTVAEIVAKLFHALGILEKAVVKTVDRRDLVGAYIGHTEQQTGRAIDEAMGGVLFIDEAYQLAAGGATDFGHQAIETLLVALENERSSFVVIFAGYTEQMEQFLDTNPGLRSRIPHTIEFPDYTPEEVGRIAAARLSSRWDVNGELVADVASCRYAALPERDRSNGRWARTFTEQLEQHHRQWVVDHPDATDEELRHIDDEVVESMSRIA